MTTLKNLVTTLLILAAGLVAFLATDALVNTPLTVEAASIEIATDQVAALEDITTTSEAVGPSLAAVEAPVVAAEPTWTDDMVIDVLTRPDFGGSDFVGTRRFTQDTVLVYADFGAWGISDRDGFVNPDTELEAVLSWLTDTTGTEFVRTPASAAADIHVGTTEGDWFGEAQLLQLDGEIQVSTATVTCCYRRLIWEEVTQAAGAVGDKGPTISLYSNSATRPKNLVAGDFEAVVFDALYNLPAGSTPAEIQAYLDAQ